MEQRARRHRLHGGLAGAHEAGAVVDFGPISPRRLDPAAYPLATGTGGDLFGWPRVADDRNVMGPLSIAVPGHVDGLGLAHEKFGRLSWSAVLAPAIEQAERGLPVDWFTTLRVAMTARELARFPTTAPVWLPGGYPPVTSAGAPLGRLRIPRLADTLRRISRRRAPRRLRGRARPQDLQRRRNARRHAARRRPGGVQGAPRRSPVLRLSRHDRPDGRRPDRRPDDRSAGWRCSAGRRSVRHPRPTPTSPMPTR